MKFATVFGALSSRSLHWSAPFDVSIFATSGPLPGRSFVASAIVNLPSSGSGPPFPAGGASRRSRGGVLGGVLGGGAVVVAATVVVVVFAESTGSGESSAGPVLHATRR